MIGSRWTIAATVLSGLAVGALVPGAALAQAGQEQWLRYRTGDDVERIVGRMPGQTVKLTSTRPDGVALPKLAATDPLFGLWQTPAVKSGGLWMALVRSRAGGPYDLLYVDTNADGSLADQQLQNSQFPPVKLLLPGSDGPTANHLGVKVQICGGQGQAVTSAACWYEGNIAVNGQATRCILADANANGVFNDASKDSEQADRIRLLDLATPFAVGRAGKFIQVGGKLHSLTVAPDGACLEIASTTSAEFVRVRVPKSVSRLSVAGGNGLLLVEPADGPVQIPPDSYRLNHWEACRKDAAGFEWRIIANALDPRDTDIELASSSAATLDIGEPLVSRCDHSATGPTHVFSNPCIRGRRNETIIVTRQGQQPPPPTVMGANADKTYEKRFSFEYG